MEAPSSLGAGDNDEGETESLSESENEDETEGKILTMGVRSCSLVPRPLPRFQYYTPPPFLRVTLKTWEWPGDEATCT